MASSEFKVVKYDEKGLVTEGRKIIDDDISGGIDASKIGFFISSLFNCKYASAEVALDISESIAFCNTKLSDYSNYRRNWSS